MAINNSLNLKVTGVVTADGAGGFTGSTVTNHGVVTASTNNTVTSVAPGTSGNVLTSNGTDWTSAAPAGGSSGTMILSTGTNQATVVDATTYYWGLNSVTTTAGSFLARTPVAITGTITALYGSVSFGGSPSSENLTLAIRLNNTTDTTLTSTFNLSGGSQAISFTGLSLSVVPGDYLQFKVIMPTFATNPTNMSFITVLSY